MSASHSTNGSRAPTSSMQSSGVFALPILPF
jgi:hypothetical protein